MRLGLGGTLDAGVLRAQREALHPLRPMYSLTEIPVRFSAIPRGNMKQRGASPATPCANQFSIGWEIIHR